MKIHATEGEDSQMHHGRLLIIDDEDIVRASCRRILEIEGYEVQTVRSGAEGLQALSRASFDLVFTDLKMPDMDGIEVLRKAKELRPDTEVIVMTGYGTVSSAVKAMKIGAFDFIEKPFTPEELTALLTRALERKKLALENLLSRMQYPPHYELGNIVGVSFGMQKVFHLIAKVCHAGSTVLITGESGTGKELVAKAIHYNSPRKDLPFVVVDCTTIPDSLIESELFGHAKGAFTGAHEKKKGLIEMAHKGSIFFDEIGNLDISVQAKLLRVLQEKEFRPLGEKRTVRVDVRFISATNKNLQTMTREGSFREDFFYRLNIFPVHVPALRERQEDIPHLAYHFLQKYSQELKRQVNKISAEAMKILVCFDWPGNVRQLENTIHRAVLMCPGKTLRPEHFSPLMTAAGEDIPRNIQELKRKKKSLRIKSVEEVEKSFLVEALRRNQWNISRAASDVKMQRTNFHALLKKHNITRKTADAVDQ